MKVSMVLASEHNGGLEKHVRELSHELVMQGHQVSVIAPTVFLNTLNQSVEKLSIDVKRSRFNLFLLWQLYRHLKNGNADIIHAQANKAACMVGFLKRFLNQPMVATLHNQKRNLRAFAQFKHIICVSRQISQNFKSDQEVSVIYNGTYLPALTKIDLKTLFDLPMDQFVICAVGRLVKAKGFDLLLEAINGMPVSLLIVGEGPEATNLMQQIKALHHPTHVQLIGHRQDVNDLIYSSDALVIASRREGFPYVFVEAVMSQAKILATHVPVAEVLPTDLVVPVEDVKALRSQLIYLMAHLDEWESLMQPVRQFVTTELQCSTMAKHTIAKYQSAIGLG
jgi:glycosyltransferase involved in cell wall biosynthesis